MLTLRKSTSTILLVMLTFGLFLAPAFAKRGNSSSRGARRSGPKQKQVSTVRNERASERAASVAKPAAPARSSQPRRNSAVQRTRAASRPTAPLASVRSSTPVARNVTRKVVVAKTAPKAVAAPRRNQVVRKVTPAPKATSRTKSQIVGRPVRTQTRTVKVEQIKPVRRSARPVTSVRDDAKSAAQRIRDRIVKTEASVARVTRQSSVTRTPTIESNTVRAGRTRLAAPRTTLRSSRTSGRQIKSSVAPRQTKTTATIERRVFQHDGMRRTKSGVRRPRATRSTGTVGRTPTTSVSSFGRRHFDRSRTNVSNIRYDGRIAGRYPGRIFTRVVWPRYRYPILYRCGPRYIYRYHRPYYHRKYVFVSIGGWWPVSYTYLRYYWYGWYPWHWYGCYPSAYCIDGGTYNYYTYNYYDAAGTSSTLSSTALPPVDETTFADVREKLAAQAAEEPLPETTADDFFADGVEAFEQGDYEGAAKAFADAVALEPNDLILPFAYVQALFANEQYSLATDALREALLGLPADQQGLFFPRGLYAADETLFEQIESLSKKVSVFDYDPDMILLLGYQLVGVEKYDEAKEVLKRAGEYEINKESAEILLDLLTKLEEQTKSV